MRDIKQDLGGSSSKSLKKRFLGGVGLALVIGIPALGYAENQFVAAANCVVISGPAASYTSRGELRNVGTTTQTSICPVERGAFGPTATVRGAFNVSDNNTAAGEAGCCSARSANADGNPFFASATVCSNNGRATYSIPDLSISGAGSWNYHYLLCTLPPAAPNASSLNGYRIGDV